MRKHNRGKHFALYCTDKKTIRKKGNKIFSFLFILVMFFVLLNINNIMAYFTSTDSVRNIFSINAEYTVSFDSNSGTGTMNDQVISYNVQTPLSSNSYSKTNYVFKEWNTNRNGSGTSYSNEDEVLNIGDITLYAQWELQEFDINYVLNGGSVETSNPATYNVETATFTLNNPTKEGATFKGWSGTGLTGDTNLVVTIPQGSTGDREYIAHWISDEETYVIKYNANGGSGSMADQSMIFDVPDNLTLNSFTRNNYLFKEWNTKSDGSGTRYLDGQEVVFSNGDVEDEITLYAQWSQGVAVIDGEPEEYSTLQAAITAAGTGTHKTVRLLTDVTEFVVVENNQNITLDLQTYSVSEPNATSDPIIDNKGTLRIINGTLTTSTTVSAVINNESTGRLYISGGNIINNNTLTGSNTKRKTSSL